MDIEDFNYYLPEELIAQKATEPRDHSRLLVLNRTGEAGLFKLMQSGHCHCEPLSSLKAQQSIKEIALSKISRNDVTVEHRHFYDVADYLEPGDLLILNNSKVFPARLIGQKEMTGGQVEILLNHEIEPGLWESIGKNLKIDNRIKFLNSKLKAVVIKKEDDVYRIRFNMTGQRFFEEIEKIGLTPLPPYIKGNIKYQKSKIKNMEEDAVDKKRYQTVFAKNIGSVAAPTAGLHFTSELLKEIKKKGVSIEYVTLHVGLGTFAPIKTDQIEKHQIHKEYFSAGKKVIERIIKVKKANHRVIVVGTTSVRALETIFSQCQMSNVKCQKSGDLTVSNNEPKKLKSYKLAPNSYSGWTNIFIYPGYKFKVVDAMITNFHLPKSSLLLLVSAFAGKKNIDQAYMEAINQKYRFYSYGDAMLIL